MIAVDALPEISSSQSPSAWVRYVSAEEALHASSALQPAVLYESRFQTSNASESRASALLLGYEEFLMPNWDGDGAEPISLTVLERAREIALHLLAHGRPAAAPGADGSIGFEWWCGAAHLFIDIGPGEADVELYARDASEAISEEKLVWGAANFYLRLDTFFHIWLRRSAPNGVGWGLSSANTSLDVFAFDLVMPQMAEIAGFDTLLLNPMWSEAGSTTKHSPRSQSVLQFLPAPTTSQSFPAA